MRLRDVFRTQWEAWVYPWPAREIQPRVLDEWEPYAVGDLQAGHRMVFVRRRIPFLERVATYLRHRASSTAADQGPAGDGAPMPVRGEGARGRAPGAA